MIYYELFKNATKEELATLLASLTGGTLGATKPEELQRLYKKLLEFLEQEVPQEKP